MLPAFRFTPCEHDHHGRYCSKCGQETDPAPLDFRTIANEFVAAWLQRGFRASVIGLTLAPGNQIRHYLRQDRSLLVKPVSYLIVIAAFHYWVLGLYNPGRQGLDDAVIGLSPQESHGQTGTALRWMFEHFYQLQLFQAILMALILRFVLFRGSGFRLPEFTIASTYILAQTTLFQSVITLFFTPFHQVPPQGLPLLVSTAYTAFALSQLLGVRRPGQFARVLLAQALAIVTSLVVLVGGLALWENWPSISA